jgi:hypothetical protein
MVQVSRLGDPVNSVKILVAFVGRSKIELLG